MRNFNVYVNGKLYEVGVEEVSGERVVTAAPAPAAASADAPAPAASAAAVPAAPKPAPADIVGGEIIKAPMPGTIVKVCVEAGQSIKKGDVMVVLEAMKMENEIMASRDTIIKAVQTSKGAAVSTGDPLVVIE